MKFACVYMNMSKECVYVCVGANKSERVLLFFFFFPSLVCDVHNGMTDAGMRVLVCVAVRKFEGVCVCVWAEGSVWGINSHFDTAVSFLNLYLSREKYCWTHCFSFSPSPCFHIHTHLHIVQEQSRFGVFLVVLTYRLPRQQYSFPFKSLFSSKNERHCFKCALWTGNFSWLLCVYLCTNLE